MVPEWVKVAAAMILPSVGALAGQRLTRKTCKRDMWYKALKRPFFCPPSWVFGPTWIGLYSSMGYASYLIWRDGGGFIGRATTPLVLYSTQLAMNWAWNHLFFGAKMIGMAEIELVALFGMATATAVSFKSINTTAYRLILPYLAWLAFSGVSIFEIWRLNRKGRRLAEIEERKDG